MLSLTEGVQKSATPGHRWQRTARHGAWLVSLPLILSCGGSTEPVTSSAVASVSITPSTLLISEIQTSQLSASTKTAKGTIVTDRPVGWTSSAPTVATVSLTGLVTGVSPGTAVITATSESVSAMVATTVTVSPCNSTSAVPIVAGQTINATLSNTDCPVGDGTYLKGYKFVITAQTTVDILLKSTAFNAYLFLFMETAGSNALTRVAENDNAADGSTNAEITGLLNVGTYYILANSINVGGAGPYTLTFISPALATLRSNMNGAPSTYQLNSRGVLPGTLPRTQSNGGALFRGLVRQ